LGQEHLWREVSGSGDTRIILYLNNLFVTLASIPIPPQATLKCETTNWLSINTCQVYSHYINLFYAALIRVNLHRIKNMSRASISTGNVTFNFKKAEDSSESTSSGDNEACHMVIMADFSGRDHRRLNDFSSIKQRKIIKVDRDNFDEVFAKLDVQCALPIADEPICFAELDDMHPDFIYERVPLFDHLRALKRKLKSQATFDAAAAEIFKWYEPSESVRNEDNIDKDSDDTQKQDVSLDGLFEGELLDNILSDPNSSSSTAFNIQALIKDVIAPYVSPKTDPRQKELLQTVDDATSDLMRKIMHHKQFQNIESAWRSLDRLVRRAETDQQLKLFIVDISQQELILDAIANDSFEQSNLYKLLVANRASSGSIPFSVMMHDASFGHSVEDIVGLDNFSSIASSCGAIAIAAGTEKLAGCESLAQTPDSDDWSFKQDPDIAEVWQALRSTPQANSLILTAPRYLCRMPYGKKSARIESFDFEELPTKDRHGYYLWSSGAWLVTLMLAQNYSVAGNMQTMTVEEIDKLPLHIYYEDDESLVTPCAETDMLDSAASALQNTGLTTIRSILNKDAVVIPELMSIKK